LYITTILKQDSIQYPAIMLLYTLTFVVEQVCFTEGWYNF